MKELTIEQKAQRYDEAIEKLRDFYRDYDTVSLLIDVKDELVNLFPELKESDESEDEKIRKWLIALIKSNEYGSISKVGEMPCSKLNVLAWLEKQGEQKPATWSKEDDAVLDTLIRSLEGEHVYVSPHLAAECLKSLRDRYTWKPSEEQMETLEYYMHTLVCNEHKEILFGLYADLKKLTE